LFSFFRRFHEKSYHARNKLESYNVGKKSSKKKISLLTASMWQISSVSFSFSPCFLFLYTF
jgi:hypothetical protein